jgi:putative two-component system response regulator
MFIFKRRENMRKVLIVDDSKTILKTAKLILQDLYEIYLANCGNMALDILEKKDIEIVLMDVDMPEMDGIETVRRIREMEKVKDVPVVFFTALGTKEIVEKCKAVGMSGYVLKPYRPDELIDTIKAVLHE